MAMGRWLFDYDEDLDDAISSGNEEEIRRLLAKQEAERFVSSTDAKDSGEVKPVQQTTQPTQVVSSPYRSRHITLEALDLAEVKPVQRATQTMQSVSPHYEPRRITLQALCEAAQDGNLDEVKQLIKDKVDPAGNYRFYQYNPGYGPAHEASWQDTTPLHSAALAGHLNVVRYLILEAKVDVNATTKNNRLGTPLHAAVSYGQLHIVTWLLKNTDVNPLQTNRNHATSLHLCADSSDHAMATQIARKLLSLDSMLIVIETFEKNPSLLLLPSLVFIINEYLSNVKEAVNMKDNQGMTPLFYAVSYGNTQLAKFLVRETKADCFAKHNNGMTVVHFAAASNYELLRWLIEKRLLDPRVLSQEGMSPLFYAAIAGCLDSTQYLFDIDSGSLNVKVKIPNSDEKVTAIMALDAGLVNKAYKDFPRYRYCANEAMEKAIEREAKETLEWVHQATDQNKKKSNDHKEVESKEHKPAVQFNSHKRSLSLPAAMFKPKRKNQPVSLDLLTRKRAH